MSESMEHDVFLERLGEMEEAKKDKGICLYCLGEFLDEELFDDHKDGLVCEACLRRKEEGEENDRMSELEEQEARRIDALIADGILTTCGYDHATER